MIRLVLALLAAVPMLSRCDADSYLSGQWFSSVDMADQLGVAKSGQGIWVELNLGHYGEEVVGVIRYYKSDDRNPGQVVQCGDREKDPAHKEGEPALECTCEFLGGVFDSDSETLSFTVHDCAGKARCVSMHRENDSLLTWTMDSCGGGGQAKSVTFDRKKDESQLSTNDKACTKCSPIEQP